ncbi:MAG: hypothetical protein ACPLRW_04710 [Moorellales bacterium]
MQDPDTRMVFVTDDWRTFGIRLTRAPHAVEVSLELWHRGRRPTSLWGRLAAAWRAFRGEAEGLGGFALGKEDFARFARAVVELADGIELPEEKRQRLLLANLRELTDEILAEAEGQVEDAVNWADLRCTEACLITDHEGDRRYAVYVSEADPNAVRLQEFVRERLAEMGYESVEVVTEW